MVFHGIEGAFVKQLLQRFPDWTSHTELCEHGVPLIDVPPPHGGRFNLMIETDEDEATLNLGMWHEHHGLDEAEMVAQRVDDLLSERVVIAVSTKDGAWTGSRALPSDDLQSISPDENSDTVALHSWRGSFDREIRRPAASS